VSVVDWLILGAVLLAVGAAAFFAVRRKKRGECCGDCGACAGCMKKGADKSEQP
jgi:LPXTG-motif cell wall-anchored protein